MRKLFLRSLMAAPVVAGGAGIVVVAMFFTVAANDSGGATLSLGECSAPVVGVVGTSSMDADQLANARTIVATGAALGVPARGLVIAVATALQESGLRNLDHGDRDSVGLFQQRPSAGWGTTAELTTPTIAAQRFFAALLAVQGWESMPLTIAAQAVQRSAFPLAYAKWEQLAASLVGGMPAVARAGAAIGSALLGCGTTLGVQAPSGAVGDMLRAALAQQGKPYVWGATGPDAFDCSGLIVYAWRLAGYQLAVRTSEQMFASSRAIVAGSEQPGDLLFGEFGPAGPAHVMLVIRPGLAVEAPHAGDVVRLQAYVVGSGWALGRLAAGVVQAAGPV